MNLLQVSCCGAPKPAAGVRKVSAEWTRADFWGMIRSRTTAFRMQYIVEPGLYSVGEPDADSDVLVSANYKLSFDVLRRHLKGMSVWLLVLDTKGINVWCAAGKGTFGTEELVRRIREARLEKVVNHKRLIVPQLGAVGVNARSVLEKTGFRVYFGPVHAKDIAAYVRNGYKKTAEMRTVGFTMSDRMVLTPMEINPAMKKFPLYSLIVLLLFGLQPSGIMFRTAWDGGYPFLIMGLGAVLAGAFLTPVLLPYVPFRSFAVKGWLVGMLSVFLSLHFIVFPAGGGVIFPAVACIFFPSASSYLALQFTGSTTFTGMSGVKKELKYAVPVYIASVAVSLILLLTFKLGEWGIL